MMGRERVSVLICTYLRPRGLEDLLTSLSKSIDEYKLEFDGRVEIVVVDNDAEGSAEPIVRDYADSLKYVVEPIPGIASARNRCLAEASIDSTYLVFVDDDEIVTPGWLSALRRTIDSVPRPSGVMGNVYPDYASEGPRLAKWLDFHRRPELTPGEPVRWPATNNLLLLRDCVGRLDGNHFSEAFSLTGGSDSEFLLRYEQINGAIVGGLPGSEIIERIPRERMSARWLWRRGERLGNVSSRLKLAESVPRAKVIALGALRIPATVPLVLLAVLRREPLGPALWNIPKGIGMIRAIRGNSIREYERVIR